jgi:GNAT superfamily N-acetyltransferase
MNDGMKNWLIRPLAAGDETAILALSKLVFGCDEPLERWRSLFPDNPFSRPIVYVAVADDGRLIGHYAFIPTPFRKGGRPTLAALAYQSMIHPDFQRQGILKALAAAAEKQLDEDRMLTAMAFVNDKSFHAYTAHFGWTKLVDCPIYFAVVDPREPLEKALKWAPLARLLAPAAGLINALLSPGRRARSSDIAIRRADRFDSRVDDLWRTFSGEFPHAVERDSRYLNWRFAGKPARYSILLAESASPAPRLLGAAVVKVEKKFGLLFGYVVELFHDPARPEAAELLVARALEEIKSSGCSMATALTLGPASLKKALGRCGFWKLPRALMPHGIHFLYKDRAAEKAPAGEYAVERWFLSWSDHDAV